nr:Glu/Leu/Phe/Val dehydrogenase dimerization domain-containing protein [Brevibacterium sp. XM4083]
MNGWVVVDSLVDSLAMGGTRMTPDVSLSEVAALARVMTSKLHLVGLPIGGAKAGIVSDGTDRDHTMQSFGRTVAPLLHGGIHLGVDMGVTPADRATFFSAAHYDPRRKFDGVDMPYDWRTYYEPLEDCTGHGVGTAAVTALDQLGEGAARSVVLQGFGSVGRAVAAFLVAHGHRLIGVADVRGTVIDQQGLPLDKLLAATNRFGVIDRDQLLPETHTVENVPGWLTTPADVLVLAANQHAINDDNVDQVDAAIVVEGGNQCISPGARKRLAERGITVVHDTIANVGGAAAAGLALTRTVPFELPGPERKAWVFNWVAERVAVNTRDLLEAAKTSDDPIADLLTNRKKAVL